MPRMPIMLKRFGLLLVLLVPWNILTAQTTHINGVVLDSNGSPINAAEVVLKVDQKVINKTLSDDAGRFQFNTELRPNLSVDISASGFTTTHANVDQSVPLRIVLTPASVSANVTVTATRTATRLGETAASVVQLNSSDLQSTAAITLDDSLRQVAGFSLFRRSGSRTANPTSQGVSLRATGASGASRALVLADGVPLNDPFGGWIYWDRVPRESISAVEVLLGGASHLYGSAALGGVIDVTTKRPATNTFSLNASYGNENTPGASLFAGGTKHGWSSSLAAETFRTDGYILVPTNERGSVDTPAGTRDSAINLRVEKRINDTAQIFGTASFFGEARENGTPLQTNRTHLRQFALGASWQPANVGSFTLRAYGGTQTYDQNFTAISAARNSESLTRVQRVPAQAFGYSGQWTRAFGVHQTFVAGFEGREVRGASDEIAYVNGRATSFIGAGGRERSEGGYIEDLLTVGPRIFINLGGRFDHWRNFAAALATRPITATNPTSVNRFPDRTENAFSPHGSLVYRINDRVSLLGSMSRAYRAPTLNELYRSFRVGNVSTLANENLRAERLTGGEAGVRVTNTNNKLNFRGSFYWNDITRPVANVTLTTTPALITRQRQNLGRTRSRGIELQTDLRLTRKWDVSGSYLFADATVVEFPANTALEGLRLPQVPRHQLTFQTRYSDPRIATIGFQGRASSSQFDDDQNQFRLGSYFTLDAFVSRKLSERLEIFAAVENVFDQRYEVGKTPVTILGPPLLLRAGFRIQVGR
jgi:outer membrane receptor protein involved in Fe transport